MEFLKIIILCMICISFIIGWYCILSLTASKRAKNKQEMILKSQEIELENKRINITTPINEDTINLLDIIINMRFQDVLANHIEITQMDFINKETEVKLRTELTNKVTETLSESLIDKLSLIYDPDSLPTAISEKILLTVMTYKVQCNSKNIDSKK